MKKILVLFIVLLGGILLTGCGAKVQDLVIDDIVACIDTFEITDYSFKVVYSDGTEEEVQLALSMLSAEDQEKLYDIGEHVITINYEKVTKQINITLEERKAISINPIKEEISSYLQEFNYSMVKFEVKFNDGTTEEVELSRDFLENDDIIALGKAGTYDITVEYEGLSTTVKIELLPNEVAVESLNKDVVVYCMTKKVNDKYQAKFYVLGNSDFASLQFKLNKGSKTTDLVVLEKNEKTTVNEENLIVTYVNSENVKGTIELFTLEFSSSQQYRNFTMDYDVEEKIVVIKNNQVEEITDYIFTFTR